MPQTETTYMSEQSSAYLPHMAKGVVINLFGAFIRNGLLFVYTFLLARTLTAGDLGKYFLLFTIVNVAGSIATMGMDFGIVRFIALFVGEGSVSLARNVFKAGVIIGILLSLVFTVVLLFAAPLVARILMNDNGEAILGLRIFALSIPFWVTARLLNSTSQGLHIMKHRVYSRDVGEQASKLLFSIFAIGLGAGLIGVVWANVASVIFAMSMSLWFVILALPKNTKNEKVVNQASSLFRYSYPLAFSYIIATFLSYIDLLMLGHFGNSADVGYYGSALRIIGGIQILFLAFSTVFMPIISDLYNKGSMLELQVLYKTVCRWLFVFTLPFLLILILFSSSIMKLFGGGFVAADSALIILAIGQLIYSSVGTAGLMISMSGHPKIELYNVIFSLMVNFFLCFLLIPDFGMLGAAVANTSAYVAINLARVIEVWFLLKMHTFENNYFKPLIAGAAVTSLILILSHFKSISSGLGFFIAGVIFLMVSYIGIFLVQGLSGQDLIILQHLKNRLNKGEAVS